MDSQGVISRAALGRMASVGDLYDARTDNFCGISIFKKEVPPGALKILDADFSDVHRMHSDTYTDKFSKLDVKAEQSVSVLAGLLKLEGSGRYLEDKKKSTRTVKSSLVYKIQTKDENVNIYHEDLKKAFAIDAIENGVATHVVTGISWGANSILSCFYENNEKKDVKNIEGNLSAQLKKVSWSISGKASVDFNEGEVDKSIQFDIRIFGDVLPKKEDLPTTVEGAIQLMKQLPSLVANCNGGKGKPLTFRLIPISLLKNYLKYSMAADIILKTLEGASMTRVVQLFDQMSNSQQELYDFDNDVIEHKYCVMVEDILKISNLKNEMAVEEISVRSKLSTVLKDVRSGIKDASEVNNLIHRFQSSPVSPQNVTALLNTWDSLREKIAFAKSLKQNGAKYIGIGSSLDEETFKDFDFKLYVLFFTQKSKSQDLNRWNGNRQLFFQEMKKKEDGRRYYAVDCDIHPDLLPKNTSSTVQVIQRGKIITEDLLQDQEKVENAPRVNFIAGTVRTIHKPKKIVPLTIPCTGLSCNPTQKHEWICRKCSRRIEYGFDDRVYCDCGKTRLAHVEFKCTDPKHGLTYERHDDNYLMELISELGPGPLKELNILILGEIGVGKSLWINTFLNFITHESFPEAESEKFCITLIPTRFRICGNKVEMTRGTSKNEVHSLNTDDSTTQEPRGYVCYVGNRIIRLIDTPGIGGARTIGRFRKTLATLSNLEYIHGICILLRKNTLNLLFRYCIKELLANLHREASKNIIFWFTDDHGFFGRPDDTMTGLKAFLNENKNAEVALNRETVYCFDKEAFLFLSTVNSHPIMREFNSYNNPDEKRKKLSKSWEKSFVEAKRMLEHIESLPPHPIKTTLILNSASELISKLSTALVTLNDCKINCSNRIDKQDKIIKEYEDELQEIQRTSVTFAGFQKGNAITPYNDAMEEYMTHLIEMEKRMMHRVKGYECKNLQSLIHSRESYVYEKQIMEEQIGNEGGFAQTPEQIDILVNKLKRLKHTGTVVKNSLDCRYSDSLVYAEKVVNPPLQ